MTLPVCYFSSVGRSGNRVSTMSYRMETCRRKAFWMHQVVLIIGKRHSHAPNDTDLVTRTFGFRLSGSNAFSAPSGTKFSMISLTLYVLIGGGPSFKCDPSGVCISSFFSSSCATLCLTAYGSFVGDRDLTNDTCGYRSSSAT